MKKLCISAAALLLLAGCGSSAKTETKSCSVEKNGLTMTMTSEAKDKKIVKQIAEFSIPKASFEAAGQDLDKMTDEQLKAYANTMTDSQKDVKGISTDIKKTDDALVITAVADSEKMDEDTFKSSGFKDMTLEDFTKQQEEAGFTCK